MVALGPTVALSVSAGELDRGLVRLGAGVGEEHAPTTTEEFVDASSELGLHRVVVQVRDVEQRAGLIGDRVGDDGVGMAE